MSEDPETVESLEMPIGAPSHFGADAFVCDLDALMIYRVDNEGKAEYTPMIAGVHEPGSLLELLGLVFYLERDGRLSATARDMFAGFISHHAPWS